MATYPLYTVLQVPVVDNIEYTATITQDGVWQTKGRRGTHDVFPTVEAWLATIPGQPAVEEIQANYYIAEQHERLDEKKKKVTKNKWIIPKKSSSPLPYYLYSLIKECDTLKKTGLLLREDIKNAFHHFVLTLTATPNIDTHMPRKYNYYYTDLSMTDIIKHIARRGYPYRLMPSDEDYKKLEAAYLPLYELLKDNVVPWMAQKWEDIVDETDLKENRFNRDKYIKKIEELTESYNNDMKYLHEQAARYQGVIDKIQNKRNPL